MRELAIKRNQIIEIVAGKPIYGGKVLSFLDGQAVIIEKCLPGEKVKARILKTKNNYLEAEAIERLEVSPHRIEPVCPYFPTCGGCKMLDVDYDFQLKLKEEAVLDCLERIGKARDFTYLPIAPSPLKTGYRNKMEMTFSCHEYMMPGKMEDTPKPAVLGFHVAGFYKKIIDIDYCYLQSPELNQVYRRLRELLLNCGLPCYDIMKHEGILRHLVMRETSRGDIMVNVVSAREDDGTIKKIAETICREFPAIKSFHNTINRGQAAVAFGEKSELLAGSDILVDYINDLQFEVSVNSFFQVNSHQTPTLYQVAADFAEFNGTEKVLDLYCGVGSITLFVSRNVNTASGFELIENAVVNARKNATLNNIDNCQFECGDMLALAKANSIFTEKFDVLITDPPRDGMHPKVTESINRSGIKKIVYISCNPSTLARDIEALSKGGYKLVKAQAVDMFPNTYHVETVALLVKERKK